MTTTHTTPTSDPIESIRARLSELVGRPELRHRKLGRANPAVIALALHHDVYSLGVGQLVEGVPIQDARPVAEAYLVLDGATVIAIAKVSRGHVTISEGPAVDALWRAIRLVDADTDMSGVEVRVLHVPQVNLLALWLHGPDGRDVFVPVARPPAPVRAYRRYEPAELTELLVGVGRRHVRPPDGGD